MQNDPRVWEEDMRTSAYILLSTDKKKQSLQIFRYVLTVVHI